MKDTLDPTTDKPRNWVSGFSILFAATVFLGAFLLFQVQPIIGKYILPWFGSTPGVWATALMFFQLMLLGGYAYAHLIATRLKWRAQAVLHQILLLLALILLPITPVEALKPTNADAPIARILLILVISVGVPYLLLSATAPLLQRWFAELHPGRSPYRLYALSNLGSMLGLVSYPFLVERFVLLEVQTLYWSLAYIVFAFLCGACAWKLFGRVPGTAFGQGERGDDTSPPPVPSPPSTDRPGWARAVLWLSLSACGSALLLATTNQMSLDIAVAPFLWILPLSLYLLTFILSFDSERWYVRPFFTAMLPLALINAVRLVYGGISLGIVDQVVGYSLSLFVCCMCLHGELARLKPEPHYLTFFFFIVSGGGALGGLFVAILAPAVFSSFYEFQILLVACYVLVAFVLVRELLLGGESSSTGGRLAGVLSWICWATALAVIVIGSTLSFIPGTWFDEDASRSVTDTFASWQTDMKVFALVTAGLLLVILELWRRRQEGSLRTWWASGRGIVRAGLSATLAMGLLSLGGGLLWQVRQNERLMVAQGRNFYGMLAIKERSAGQETHRLSLTHGRINHGNQLQRHKDWPTSYFGPESGIGLAIQYHPRRSEVGRQFRVGVVGLGVGALAAYANASIDPRRGPDTYVMKRETEIPDYMRFYELNPQVTRWAMERFTYLGDATERGADLGVFEGDARIVLEHQLALGQPQRFDVLAIDAFSSDAIPIHLITRESFRTYMRHLNRDGILAIQVTNRFVDLIPVVRRLAEATGMIAIYIENSESSSWMVNSSDWILLTTNRAFLGQGIVHKDVQEMPESGPLWTDDFSSLFEVVEFDD